MSRLPLSLDLYSIQARQPEKVDGVKGFYPVERNTHHRIISDEGIHLRKQRSIQVEGAFGVLKPDYHFRQFLTRGTNKTSIEFLLLCLAYNLKKLHTKIQTGRNVRLLQEKKLA